MAIRQYAVVCLVLVCWATWQPQNRRTSMRFHEENAEVTPHTEVVDTFDWKSRVRFFVLGVQKGGTTSLYKYMGEHPQISSPGKELRCFNMNYRPSDPFCANFFAVPWIRDKHKDYITGDFSPGYILSQRAVYRVKRAYPNARFIVTLRNPIDRAVSQFKMNERNEVLGPGATFESFCLAELEILRKVGLLSHWTFPPTFDDRKHYSEDALMEMYLLARVNETEFALNFASPSMLETWDRLQHVRNSRNYTNGMLRAGLYAPQLHQWFESFPREQFLVFSLEETERDTQAILKRIHVHLGIPHVPLNDTTAENTGNTKALTIPDPLHQILVKLYRPFDNMIAPVLQDENWELPWTL